MIHYLYTGNYQTARDRQIASPDEDTPIIDARVYLIADQFLVVTLKDWAKREFERRLGETWDSEAFIHTVEDLWDYDEYQPLYRIIEQVIAKHVDELLATADAASLITRGLADGMFSLDFLH